MRLSVFRSNKFLYAQLIDDGLSKTLVSSASIQKQFKDIKCSPKEMAFKIGEDIGSKILKKKLKKNLFGPRWISFHGRVKRICIRCKIEGN